MELDQTLSEEDLHLLRERAKNDLYFFAKGILGYKDLVPHVHLGVARFLEDSSQKRRMVLMPRGHFKTTIGTISDTIRLLAKNPNLRILLANESAENAELMLAEIRRHFENNARLRAIFPELIPKNFSNTVWSRNSLLLPREETHREPSVMAAGVKGAVVSRHFNILKFDDIIGEEAKNSPSVMSKTIGWLNHAVSLFVNPTTDEMHIIGTRWHFSDAYSHALEKMGFALYRTKPVIYGPDGRPAPLFKERYSLEFFQSIIENDPEQWATQYANDPMDATLADFKKEWLRFYWITPDGDIRYKNDRGELEIQERKKLRIYTHIDPSMGESPKSDFSAVVTVGVSPKGQIFVLDTWHKRVDPLTLTEKIFEVHEHFSPRKVSIEAVAFQKSLRYFIEQEARRRRVYISFEDYKPSTRKSKEARVRGALQPYFSTGQIFIRSDQIELIEQYAQFGLSEHDDIIDALAQGPEYWRAPKAAEAIKRHEQIAQELVSSTSRGMTGYGI